MLFSATVLKWEAIGTKTRVANATNGTMFLLNGNRIQGLEVRATSYSKFLYADNPNDQREKLAYIEATDTVANITTDIDKTFSSLLMSFAFYTDNDSTLATFTRSINSKDIIYVRKDPAASATRSWIMYLEGSKKRELLCPYSIAQVKELADAGDLTTP